MAHPKENNETLLPMSKRTQQMLGDKNNNATGAACFKTQGSQPFYK